MCLKGIRHVWSHAYIFICVQLTLTKVGALCSEGGRRECIQAETQIIQLLHILFELDQICVKLLFIDWTHAPQTVTLTVGGGRQTRSNRLLMTWASPKQNVDAIFRRCHFLVYHIWGVTPCLTHRLDQLRLLPTYSWPFFGGDKGFYSASALILSVEPKKKSILVVLLGLSMGWSFWSFLRGDGTSFVILSTNSFTLVPLIVRWPMWKQDPGLHSFRHWLHLTRLNPWMQNTKHVVY